MIRSKEDVIAALASGSFDSLLGEFESAWLECKRQPYDLSSEEQKLELAKDVAGLANAAGGIILVGFSTTKDTAHQEDRIDRCRPFPLDRFDTVRYRQVLTDWLWPPIEELEVQLYSTPDASDKAVAAISVPAVSEAGSPVLVAKTILGSTRRVELVFGYFERRQANVMHYDIARLHRLIRDGRRLDANIREGFDSLHALLNEVREKAAASALPMILPEEIDRRISSAADATGFALESTFALAATPEKPLNLRSLFESSDTALARLLEAPPTIRRSGFDLRSGDNSRLYEGRLRRVVTRDYKLLELHRDGFAAFVTSGEHLCRRRAEREGEPPRINSVVLVETTYLFARFVEAAWEGQVEPGATVSLLLYLDRFGSGNQTLRLSPGPIGASWGGGERAPAGSFRTNVPIRFKQTSPERVAILLLSELYSWFGLEEDRIPYTRPSAEGLVVDPDQITSLR